MGGVLRKEGIPRPRGSFRRPDRQSAGVRFGAPKGRRHGPLRGVDCRFFFAGRATGSTLEGPEGRLDLLPTANLSRVLPWRNEGLSAGIARSLPTQASSV